MTAWQHWIDAVAVGIEILAVAVMLGSIVVGTVRWSTRCGAP